MFIYSYGYTSFYVTGSKYSPANSSDKYLKSLTDKFLTNESRLEFINCMLSIKSRFVLILKAMHFSNSFGVILLLHQTYLFPLLLNDCHNLLDYEI